MSRRERLSKRLVGTLSRVLSPETKAGGQTAVEDQAVNTQEGIWKYIRAGDHEMVKKYLDEDPELINQRGPVGETVLHLLFLYNSPIHMTIARWMMDSYPRLVHTVYEKDPYIGENCLHIAIVNRNYEMVVDLLARDPQRKLLDARTSGGFFQRGKPCYFGETALGFAVCTNQPKIALYLLDHGADLDVVDTHGNNLLHLCVWHNLPDMYNLIEKRWRQINEKKVEKKILTRLVSRRLTGAARELYRRRNNDRLTPFTLAAKIGKKEMFEFLLEKRKQIEWKYGPVTCLVHPLDDLDLDLDLEDDTPAALEIIINEEHTDLLALPQLRDLINLKWTRFAYQAFVTRFIVTAIYLTIFMVTTILRPTVGQKPNENENENENPITDKVQYFATSVVGIAIRYIGETLTFLGALHKGRNEYHEMREHGISAYLNKSGSGFLENVVSSTFCMAIVSRPILYYIGSDWQQTIHSLALVLGWMYMLFFLLAFRITGPFVVMIWQMLKADVLRFVIIYGVFLAGFTSAFFVIYDHSGVDDFVAILKKVVEAEFDSSELMGGRHPIVAVVLLIAYVVTVTTLLINLLIAMMGSTFNKISETADMQWELERARIIFAIENEMTIAQRLAAKYWIDRDGDRFILVEMADEGHFRTMTEADTTALNEVLTGVSQPLSPTTQEEKKELFPLPSSPASAPSSPLPNLNSAVHNTSPASPSSSSVPDSTVFDLSGFNPQYDSQLTSPPAEMPRKKSKLDHHSE